MADSVEDEQQIHTAGNLGLRVKGWYLASSVDGLNWTSENDDKRVFVENLGLPWEDLGVATGADAEVKEGNLYFFYPSLTSKGGSLFGDIPNWPVNLATKSLND